MRWDDFRSSDNVDDRRGGGGGGIPGGVGAVTSLISHDASCSRNHLSSRFAM